LTAEHDTITADFLSGGGEIADRIRAFDWAATPLGPINSWPTSVKTTIAIILRSPVPIVTLWGEQGTMIYNDAYSGFAGGRHPQLLGSAVREGWPEVADFNDNVMKVGLAGGVLSYRDQELTLFRSGVPEQVFMNLDYSPVIGEQGTPIGVIAIVVETSGRVQAENQIRIEARQREQAQERQRRLFEQAPGFIVIMRGPEHVVEFVNDAHRTVFGSDDWIGLTMRHAFPSIEGQGFFEVLDKVYATGETAEFTATPVRYRRGPHMPEELRYLTFIYAPLFDDDGRISGIFCEGFDVTTAHLAERRAAALAELGDSFREFDDPEDIAHAAAALLGREFGVSRAGYGTIDTTAETITIDRDWNGPGIKSIAGTLRFRDYGSYIDNLKRGETVLCTNADLDPRTADNAEALKAISAHSFVNMPVTEQGGFVALLFLNHNAPRDWTDDEVAFIREVAERTRTAVERRRAEAAVRENEARLRFLDALAKETASSTDADAILCVTTEMVGRELGVDLCAYADMEPDQDHFTIRGDWSPTGDSIKGYYSLADFGRLAVDNLGAGKPLILNDLAAIAPEEAATFQALGISATICMPLVKGGRLIALMAVHRRQPHIWTQNELALLSEVTERSWAHIERVRSEAAVRESESQFRTFAQAVPNHVWTSPPDGDLDWFNDQVYAFSGMRREELVGSGWAQMVHPEDLPAAAAAWTASLGTGDPYQTEFRLRRHDGTWRWHLARAVALRDDGGRVVRWVGTNTDVHDQKNAEAVLEQRLAERTAALAAADETIRQAQKMEAIGNLTGGVAHDFNNLLAAVMGSLELLRKRLPDDPALLSLVDNAIEGAVRGTSLTRRMLAFARRQDLKSERIDVRVLVRDMAELLRRSLGPTIDIDVRIPDGLPLIAADSNQLESALLNLLVNARDAVQGEGKVVISAREETVGDFDLRLSPGRYLCLSVEDNGSGMDEATLSRATEPFFTTKGVGKGTGLGLSMVHGLAEQSGGTLVLESAPGRGTTAEVWLPALEGGASVAVAEQPALPPPVQPPAPVADQPRRLSILAVDDDALVLMNTVAMLEDLGHDVAEATSGREALAMLRDRRFDLVITDHAMPHMTGTQLAKEIEAVRPATPIILATGYAELPQGVESSLPRLSKPFWQAELAQAIGRVLSQA